MPREWPADEVAGPAVFTSDRTVLPPMWACHPANHEREENCKRVYLRSPRDDRRAWVLFDEADALRQRVTDRHFKRTDAKAPAQMQAAEGVQRFLDEERAETAYSA